MLEVSRRLWARAPLAGSGTRSRPPDVSPLIDLIGVAG